jgi:hypothetical protein
MNKYIFVIFLFLLVSKSFGQTDNDIEQDLLKYFNKIEYWSNYDINDKNIDKYDSLNDASERFTAKLLEYTSKYPNTIKQEFNELKKKGLFIATSEDSLFRIYSWDDMNGGSMRYFDNVYQFNSNGKEVLSTTLTNRAEGETGYFCSEIFSIKNQSETYYLAIINAIHSNKDSYQAIKVFTINKGNLNDSAKLIKTATGIRNMIGFEYDFFSVVDRKERPVKLIKYDYLTKTLKIPVVLESGKVTNRHITYKFTGNYFEKEK